MCVNALPAHTNCQSNISKLLPTKHAMTDPRQPTWPESKHLVARRVGGGWYSRQLISLLSVTEGVATCQRTPTTPT